MLASYGCSNQLPQDFANLDISGGPHRKLLPRGGDDMGRPPQDVGVHMMQDVWFQVWVVPGTSGDVHDDRTVPRPLLLVPLCPWESEQWR